MVPSVQIARTQTTYSVIEDKESIVREVSAIELPDSVGTEESSAVVNTYSHEALIAYQALLRASLLILFKSLPIDSVRHPLTTRWHSVFRE